MTVKAPSGRRWLMTDKKESRKGEKKPRLNGEPVGRISLHHVISELSSRGAERCPGQPLSRVHTFHVQVMDLVR